LAQKKSPPQKPELGDDLREFVESLNSRGVDYTIVGAFAVAYHGYPRYTGDLDILVRQDRENVTRLLEALAAFGFPLSVTASDMLEPKVMLTLGEIPNRIDVLTHIDGVTTDAVWATRIASKLDGLPVSFIARDELLTNKRAANRPKDLADVAELLARTPRVPRPAKKVRAKKAPKRR
jgi:hypothetical protein